MNDKRVIPDGAHHSGLMKDYGGRYNPEFSERHAEAAESLLRDAVIRADDAEAELTRLREENTRLRAAGKAMTEWCKENHIYPLGYQIMCQALKDSS